jgi:hypothetical protein
MELALLETSQSVSRSDFDSFFQEEQHYISGLVKEPPETTMQIEYVQALDRFYLATYVIPADPKQVLTIYIYRSKLHDIRESLAKKQLRLQKLDAKPTQEQLREKNWAEKRDIALQTVVSLESRLGITERWDPQMEEFKATMKLLNDRALNLAIDNVERLMVQRFMEQDKLGVASLCESRQCA